MTKVVVNPGACGLNTVISAKSEDMQIAKVSIDTECPYIKAMAAEIDEVDSFEECFSKLGEGSIYKLASKYCKHAACPVPNAIIKAVEAACGLALPKDVSIKITRE